LISSLTGTITNGSDTWLADNDASKHMTGYKDSLLDLVQKDSPHKVKLADDYQYPIKEVRETTYKLDSKKPLKIKDFLYVPGLKKISFPSQHWKRKDSKSFLLMVKFSCGQEEILLMMLL
jgi:hypothetical protein